MVLIQQRFGVLLRGAEQPQLPLKWSSGGAQHCMGMAPKEVTDYHPPPLNTATFHRVHYDRYRIHVYC